MNKIWLKLCVPVFLLVFSGNLFAEAENPQVLVEKTTERMLDALKAEKDNIKQNPSRVFTLVDEIVLPHFDFSKMAQLVLAQNWRAANDDQKTRFTREFRSLLVRTYAMSLVDYSDEKVVFLPMRGDPDKDRRVTIRAEVKQAGAPKPIPLDTDMYKNNEGEWKVYNVNVEGISLVTNYRSSFAEEVKKNGLDHLISSLEKKTAEANQMQQ